MKPHMLISFLLFLTMYSCKKAEITGTAKVTHSFSTFSKPGSKKRVDIPSGRYNVKIKAKKDSAKIEFQNGEFKEDFKFDTPKDFAKQGLYKDFKLSMKETAQSFSLVGKKKTSEKKSKTYTKSVSCIYSSYDYEVCTPGYYEGGDYVCTGGGEDCHKVPDSSDDGYAIECTPIPQHCYTTPTYWIPESCSIETDYTYGDQDKTGYDLTSQDFLSVSILDRGTTKVSSVDFVDEAKTRFVTTSSGSCDL